MVEGNQDSGISTLSMTWMTPLSVMQLLYRTGRQRGKGLVRRREDCARTAALQGIDKAGFTGLPGSA